MKIELLGSMRMPNQSVRIMRAVLDEAGINPLPLLAEAIMRIHKDLSISALFG